MAPLTSLITLVLLMWKWMGLFSRKNHLLRCWSWLSLLHWIEALVLFLLLKVYQENWSLDSFYEVSLLRLLYISINLPYSHACNTAVISGLVILVATWNCLISYKRRYAGLLVFPLLPVLNPWLIVASLSFFSIGVIEYIILGM